MFSSYACYPFRFEKKNGLSVKSGKAIMLLSKGALMLLPSDS